MLNSHLGKMGSILWSFANGYDASPVKLENTHAPIKSVGNSTTTPMHLIYKRACLSLHASCMGNRIRLGSDCTGIDMGPWERGQENALFLATASLVYIVSVTYQLLNIDGTDVNKSLNELTIYYHNIIEEHAKKQ